MLLAADLPFWRRALQLPLAADDVYLPVTMIGGDAPCNRGAAGGPRRTDAPALEYAVGARAQRRFARLVSHAHGEQVLVALFRRRRRTQPAARRRMVARPVTRDGHGPGARRRAARSLDSPVARYLREWDDEPRGRITLRQLLEETSGLENRRRHRPACCAVRPGSDCARLPAFATSKGVRMLLGNDFASTALRFELEHEPGGFYNARRPMRSSRR